jgi:hypothetical protein
MDTIRTTTNFNNRCHSAPDHSKQGGQKGVGNAADRSHSRAFVRFQSVGIVLTIFLLLFLSQTATSALAQQIFPTSYDMLNGNNENFWYLDRSYNGSGNSTQPSSFLSGGLGDLADGIIATDNWGVEPAPPANGPYVAWDRNQPPGMSPTITFHFGCNAKIDSITVHAADSGGSGGVSLPSSINVNMGGAYLRVLPSQTLLELPLFLQHSH